MNTRSAPCFWSHPPLHVPQAQRQQVRQQLEAYCGQDTEGMVWIVEALRQLCQ